MFETNQKVESQLQELRSILDGRILQSEDIIWLSGRLSSILDALHDKMVNGQGCGDICEI
jgi:hypothetical protein